GARRLVAGALYERGMIGPIDETAIAICDGQRLVNGAFGDTEAHDPPIVREDGVSRPALLLIIRPTPANACQRCAARGSPEMLSTGQLCELALAPGGALPWTGWPSSTSSGRGRRGGPTWRRAFWRRRGSRRGVGDGSTRVALRVIAMGWISAFGATTNLHGNMLLRSSAVPRGLAPGVEFARRRRLPFGCRPPPSTAGFVYDGGLEIAEVVSAKEAEALEDRAPPLLRWARECCEAAGPPGSLGRDVFRFAKLATLDELIDGVEGTRSPLQGCVTELTGLTSWALGKRRASRRLAQILFRRWVQAREGGAALISAFAWIDGAGRVEGDAARVAQRAYPSIKHQGDIALADPKALVLRLREHGRVTWMLAVGGCPSRGHAVSDVGRKGSDAPRSQPAGHLMWFIEGLNREVPEVEVLQLYAIFWRVPLELVAGDMGWERWRRLLCTWASWDLLPSFEAAAPCPLGPAKFATPHVSSAAKTEPEKCEALRRSPFGNSFQRVVDAR
ncbi:unnamed protein product, partial [Prorocentrum cordatum]